MTPCRSVFLPRSLPTRRLVRNTLAALLLAPCLGVAQTPVRVSLLSEILEPAVGRSAASVVSSNDSVISAELSAPVSAIHADVGATVSEGDLLLTLNPDDQRLLLAQAEAMLGAAKARRSLAEQRLTRGNELSGRSFISSDDLLGLKTNQQAAQADVASAQAQRDIAARSLAKTRISAPFDAVVVERHAQVGAMASPGAPLLRLVALDGAEIEVMLAPDAAASLEGGSTLRFEYAGESLPLRLLRVSPVVDSSSRTRVARLGFIDTQAPPGSTGTLSWRDAVGQVPANLLVKRDQRLGLFVDDAGTAKFVVLPNAQSGRPVSAESLAAHLRVVVEGQQGLNEGDALAIRER